MAQQKSLIKLEGTIGDLTFYNTKKGYQARQKGGVSADRIANDPNYQRTRENNAEFGSICSAAKKLRGLLRPVILNVADSRMALRLSSRMARVVKADAENVRGARKVRAENLQLLREFNFNIASELSNILFAGYVASVNRAEDSAQISLPQFNPEVAIAKPQGATHYQLNAAAAVVDFDGDGSKIVTVSSNYLSLTGAGALEQLDMPAINAQNFPVILLFGISFYLESNGGFYPLNNSAANAIMIAAIDLP